MNECLFYTLKEVPNLLDIFIIQLTLIDLLNFLEI
jgi:hypothetical protein